MRIISLNLNGIRAAERKGVFRWLSEQDADVICFQEVRACAHIVDDPLYQLPGYHCFYESAQKKGYSGVGILCKHAPDKVIRRLGFDLADEEGRYIAAEFGDLCVVSIYLPSGTSGDPRQTLKYEFMDKYQKILNKQLKSGRHYIICGDWNIAHKAIDLKNWKNNQKNSGFLPEERAWLDMLFDKLGFVDAFREVNQEPDQYTWWSHRGRAWDNNVGWRIDYQIVTPELKGRISGASIYKDERFSDHAPLIIDYDMSLV